MIFEHDLSLHLVKFYLNIHVHVDIEDIPLINSEICRMTKMYILWGPSEINKSCVVIADYKLSRVVRKPDFCLCENKGADQLRSNCEADQRLCFRYSDSTIPLLLIAKISSL